MKAFAFFAFGILLISFASALRINDSTVGVKNSQHTLNQTSKMMLKNSSDNKIVKQVEEKIYAHKKNKTIQVLNKAKIKKIIQARNRLRMHNVTNECPNNCTCTGVVVKCELNGSRQITINAGKSGNTIIVQVGGANMTTKVKLYKAEGKIYGFFKNNQTKIINVLPDEIKEKIKQEIKAKLQNEIIELDEDGTYNIQVRKSARLFGLIPIGERVRIQIDPETGEIIKIRNPWWSFLTRDILE